MSSPSPTPSPTHEDASLQVTLTIRGEAARELARLPGLIVTTLSSERVTQSDGIVRQLVQLAAPVLESLMRPSAGGPR